MLFSVENYVLLMQKIHILNGPAKRWEKYVKSKPAKAILKTK